MRTFRFLGMALMAILVGVNFIACSDDEEGDTPIKNEDGIVTNQKKLVELKETDENGTNVMTFSYDSKGRLISVVTKDYDNSNNVITNITWGNNTITSTSNGESTVFSLTDGLIRTIRSDNSYKNASFTYNSSKQLIAEQYGQNAYVDTYTWENGRITELTDGEDCIINMIYSGKTCKGYFPLYGPSGNEYIFYAHPELVGMRSTQLPDQTNYKEGDYEGTSEFTYKLDKDGYIESCIENSIEKDMSNNPTPQIYSNTTHTTTYSFKWE